MKHKPRSALTFAFIALVAKQHPKLQEALETNLPRHHRRIFQDYFRFGLRMRWLNRQVRGKYVPHQGRRERARRVFGSTHNLRLAQRYLVAARRKPDGLTPA